MKSSILAVLCLFTFISFSQSELSTAQWQSDLRFLQSTVHQKFPNLFKKISKEEFDKEVDVLYEQIPDLDALEIPVAFSRIVSLFEYGHTQIPYRTIAKNGVLPVNLYHFSDGIYIEGTTKVHSEILGAKVLKLGEVEVEEALSLIKPVVPVENESYFKAYGLRFLTVPDVLKAQGIIPLEVDSVDLLLEKDGNTFQYNLPIIELENLSKGAAFTIVNDDWLSVREQDTTPLFIKDLNDKFYYFEYLENSRTLYVRQSSVFDDPKESLKDFYTRLFEFADTNTIDRLIYDVRLNGGGNNNNNLALVKGLMARPEINQQGKLFFIIGRYTFSACQNLVNDIGTYTEAIFVGEPTAENVNFYGDNRAVTLPNSNITAYLSFAWWQDKAPWANSDATFPHIAVEMSFEDYETNKDPVLEAALTYEDDGMFLDPLQHLTDLFMVGNFDQLKIDATEIARSPKYKFYDFEEEFSKAGSQLLQNNDKEGALFVFELIQEIYPESVGALYNLATTQEQTSHTEKAIESYNKLINQFPKNILARASENRLKELRGN